MREMIKIINEETYFRRYGISLNKQWGSYDEETQAKAIQEIISIENIRDYEGIRFKKDEILRIVLGFGGYDFLNIITDNSIPTVHVVIWEPDEKLFEAYCTRTDISRFIDDDKMDIIIGDEMIGLRNTLIKCIHDYNAFHSRVIAFGKYANRDDVHIKMLTDMLDEISGDAIQDAVSRKAFEKRPCKNLLNNLRFLSNNYVIPQLFEAIPRRDIPIIIVAAGPSLMKNYKELLRVKNRAIVIAVAHAVKTLHEGGIKPELIAITDPDQTDFLACDDQNNNMLISSVYADMNSTEKYNGRIIFYGFNTVRYLFLTTRTALEAYAEMDTGSVATDMFSMLITSGFKTIILVGQDLAYDENGYTHSGGERENSIYEENELYKEVEGINGGSVLTRGDWERFRKFYERKISDNRDIHVIDATEGGAIIHGTEVMTLSEAIDNYCSREFPVGEWMTQLKKGSDEEQQYIYQWYDTNRKKVEDCIKYLDESLELNSEICESWNNREKWDDRFLASCKKYDMLYSVLLEGETGDLLRFYCADMIQKYVEDALVLEGDENTVKRLQMENDLYLRLKKEAMHLIEYIDHITG